MLWGIIAYGVAPAGLVLWLFLLSGFRLLEGAAQLVAGMKVAVSNFEVTLPMFVSLLSGAAWLYETLLLFTDSATNLGLHKDRDLMKRWRQERNWWILNCNLVLWLTIWRLSSLFASFRAKDD
mmetsp:Transcript_90651/g.210857  ORF Transcript_90651/g.210857 Transcript_90651/m.210857 type:complete len:123 (+) Transcript_90651:71-439(+)